MTAAVDCGSIVHPDNVIYQVEGAVAFALSSTLKGKISIENGRVVQSNYHDYQVLRHNEMPVVDVHLVASDKIPTGIGEPGVPPTAPAVCNAVYAAVGKRIYNLPISEQKLT